MTYQLNYGNTTINFVFSWGYAMKQDLEYIEQLLKENKSLKDELKSYRTKEDIISKIQFILKIKGELNLYRLNFIDLEKIETSLNLLLNKISSLNTGSGK